jgi:hypothetical protein
MNPGLTLRLQVYEYANTGYPSPEQAVRFATNPLGAPHIMLQSSCCYCSQCYCS